MPKLSACHQKARAGHRRDEQIACQRYPTCSVRNSKDCASARSAVMGADSEQPPGPPYLGIALHSMKPAAASLSSEQ